MVVDFFVNHYNIGKEGNEKTKKNATYKKSSFQKITV